MTDIEDTSVPLVDAATCNAIGTSSCHQAQPKIAPARTPQPVAIGATIGTIYVVNGDSPVSVTPAIR